MKLRTAAFFILSLNLISCGPVNSDNISTAKRLHDDAELQFQSAYLALATGKLKNNRPETRYPWPFEVLSIGHTMSSYQNYGGNPYFHHGLDIRGDAGADVLASAGGKVVNIENYVAGLAPYWEVAVLDEQGFLWQYHHVDKDSIPDEIWQAFRNKTSISQGTKIGEIYYWPVVTYGERYHHVHLNILDADSNYLNPFAFLEELPDQKSPQIEEIGLLKNGRLSEGNIVSGDYTIYAKVHDLILHDKFVVPPYEISYSVDGSDPITVWKFDNIPGGGSREQYVSQFFNPSMTCGSYRCRELVIDLGFTTSGTNYFTDAIGPHTIEIHTRDFVGNATSATFHWQVQ